MPCMFTLFSMRKRERLTLTSSAYHIKHFGLCPTNWHIDNLTTNCFAKYTYIFYPIWALDICSNIKRCPYQPKAVFFTCMDSRMIPTRYTDTHVGDMFVGGYATHIESQLNQYHFWHLPSFSCLVRNAGNLIPHAQHFQDEYFSCEPAALELGCVVNDIRHIIVCGHSDCKAMNLLYQLRDPDFASKVSLCRNCRRELEWISESLFQYSS